MQMKPPFSYTKVLFNLPDKLESFPDTTFRMSLVARMQQELITNLASAQFKINRGDGQNLNDNEKFAICVAAGLPWEIQETSGAFYPKLTGLASVLVEGDKVTVLVKEST